MTSKIDLSYDLMCELRSFSKWMENEHISITPKKGEEGNTVRVDALSIADFKEPMKNKLSAFMKAVAKNHIIKMNDKQLPSKKVSDLVKQFKSAKILINDEIDTSDTGYLISLDVSEDKLVKAFGNPVFNTIKDDSWSKEWKILINGHPYSIYDWKSGQGWHLAGEKKNKKDMTLLERHLENLGKATALMEDKPKDTKRETALTSFENDLKKQMEEDMKNEIVIDKNENENDDDIVFGDILDELDNLIEEDNVEEDNVEEEEDDVDEHEQ